MFSIFVNLQIISLILFLIFLCGFKILSLKVKEYDQLIMFSFYFICLMIQVFVGSQVEYKNMNVFSAIRRAIENEICMVSLQSGSSRHCRWKKGVHVLS